MVGRGPGQEGKEKVFGQAMIEDRSEIICVTDKNITIYLIYPMIATLALKIGLDLLFASFYKFSSFLKGNSCFT